MDSQVLRAINHIKYVSNKRPCTVKISNYLQKNVASNCDYEVLENAITESMNNGIIDETFKITNPIEEVSKYQQDDVDIIPENSDISCINIQSSQVDEEYDGIPFLKNITLTPNPQVVFQVTLKFYSVP